MKNRVLVPELMDDPQLGPAEHVHALRGLRRINVWTGNASLVWRPIWQLAQAQRDRPFRVLDIATGSADIPIALAKRAAKCGIELEIDACDISEQALAFAETAAASGTARPRLFQHDILQLDIPQPYDVVMCSQFLHHLTEAQAAGVLARMAAAAMLRNSC